ncbi:transposase, partial [Candidatus Collierbacteria bacterium]|nr:transposase [Candidatus Collierbacteria bacterium]
NHFHLLIKQYLSTSITDFMRSLLTRYSMYFNRKYKRVGSLFQSNYKAVNVDSEEQLVYLSRYIHRNPVTSGSNLEVLDNYLFSSLMNYLGKVRQAWVKHEYISDLFSKTNQNLTYRAFIFDTGVNDDGICSLLLDNDTLQGPTLK